MPQKRHDCQEEDGIDETDLRSRAWANQIVSIDHPGQIEEHAGVRQFNETKEVNIHAPRTHASIITPLALDAPESFVTEC
jgi:hypothetical protein